MEVHNYPLDANSFQSGQGLEWVLQNDVRDDAHHDGVVEGHNDPLEEGVVDHNELPPDGLNNFQFEQGLVWVWQNDAHDVLHDEVVVVHNEAHDVLHGEVVVVHNEILEEDGVGHHVGHVHGEQ